MKQVSDDNDEWTDIDASDDRSAVFAFMQANDYDENDFDPGRPFYVYVRNSEHDAPRKVRVRVIPAHFEVG